MSKIGIVIENYQIGKVIWQGTTSTIYIAKASSSDAKYGQQIAIKALSRRKTRPLQIKQFKNEAKILMDVDHPNIVKIFKFIEDHEDFYHLMEYIDGKSLRRITLEKTLSFNEVIRVFKELLFTLEYMQKNKIIHKDIKPENIVVSDDLNVIKLVDFGFAVKKSFFGLDHFPYAGTERYIAPERREGKTYYSSDIYSLGKTIEELIEKISDTPDFIHWVLSKCTNPLPDKRMQNARDVLEHLKVFVESIG